MSLLGQSACTTPSVASAVADATANGTTVVIAAGNQSEFSNNYGLCPDAVWVSAVDQSGSKASFTNTGPGITLAAPGSGGIYTTSDSGATAPTGSNTYKSFSGTSAAAPFVTGVISLMLSANPNLTPKQIKQILISSARRFPTDVSVPCKIADCGAGILDATSAVSVASSTRASAAGPYDGIYQWSPGNYLSLHQDGTHMIGTIYFNADGNFSFPATSGAGVLSVPQLDIFDLMNGQVVGSTIRMDGTRFHRACKVSYDFTFNDDATTTVTRVGVSNTAAADGAGISCNAIVGAEPITLSVPKIRFNPDAAPVANVGLYDGIYQWSPGNYLSLHQDGTHMIGTIYFNADGNFSFPATSGAGVLSVPQLDIFDLMNGQVVGATVAMDGTRFHRACDVAYDFTFNTDSTITVIRAGIGNTGAADAAGIACSAIVGAEPVTLSVPKIRFN